MKRIVTNFWADQSGAAMVEYAVIVGVITAATIVIVLAISGKVTNAFSNVNTAMSGSAFN